MFFYSRSLFRLPVCRSRRSCARSGAGWVDYDFKDVAACGVVVVLQMQYEKMQQVASTVMLTMLSET